MTDEQKKKIIDMYDCVSDRLQNPGFADDEDYYTGQEAGIEMVLAVLGYKLVFDGIATDIVEEEQE